MYQAVDAKPEETNTNRLLNRETTLVDLARAGDTESFDVLASTHRQRIINTVRRITGSFDDAEDIAQEALMKAFLKVRGFRGACAFSTWLTRIAINEALMWRRRQRGRPGVNWSAPSETNEAGIVPHIIDSRPNPEMCYQTKERHQLLVTGIERLRPASRLALEICDLQEGSMKDLARTQGTSLSAAKSRLFRSRSSLRAEFGRVLRAKSACSADRSGSMNRSTLNGHLSTLAVNRHTGRRTIQGY